MREKIESLLIVAAFTTVAVFGVWAWYFGSSYMEQVHNNFLRARGSEVVLIQNSSGNGATGFTVQGRSGTTVIMTNNHVCELAENGYLFVTYKENRYVLHTIKSYLYNDLCAIEAPRGAGHLSLARKAAVGDVAYIVGHPLLEPLTLTQGEISGQVNIEIQVMKGEEDCKGPTYNWEVVDSVWGEFMSCERKLASWATTATILPGNSGSPVVNNYGNVIGVAFAGYNGVRGYAVPFEDLADFLKEL